MDGVSIVGGNRDQRAYGQAAPATPPARTPAIQVGCKGREGGGSGGGAFCSLRPFPRGRFSALLDTSYCPGRRALWFCCSRDA